MFNLLLKKKRKIKRYLKFFLLICSIKICSRLCVETAIDSNSTKPWASQCKSLCQRTPTTLQSSRACLVCYLSLASCDINFIKIKSKGSKKATDRNQKAHVIGNLGMQAETRSHWWGGIAGGNLRLGSAETKLWKQRRELKLYQKRYGNSAGEKIVNYQQINQKGGRLLMRIR